MTEFIAFKNVGFLQHKFTDEELGPITQEIAEIKSNFDAHESTKHNNRLAGNLLREYRLEKSKNHLNAVVSPLLGQYDKVFEFLKPHDELVYNAPLILGDPWVNFQRKGEYNPNHNHMGVVSFAMWIKIPYNIEDEKNRPESRESNACNPGHFQFLYTNTTGHICTHTIAADKTMENTLVMFPSKMIHTVYPFYTSDDYRISISGNYYFDNLDLQEFFNYKNQNA